MPSTETQPTQACRVSVRGVHKSYRQGSRSVQALRGVDLQILDPARSNFATATVAGL
jgi:hypothetical protein